VTVVALMLIGLVLVDAFETVMLPRTVSRRVRLTRSFFRLTWRPWSRVAARLASEARRERFLAVYGPLSLIGLIVVWALMLVVGFAAIQWGAGSQMLTQEGRPIAWADDLYMSGTTLITLGLGDIHPVGAFARVVTVAEAMTGFGFLAIVIAYLPVLYQSFSRREVQLTLLDAWAGSPPSAGEVLRRLGVANAVGELTPFLKDWEYWCSELLESHISYPSVAYFRSQHQRQSWVAALATVLDVTAFVQAGIEGVPDWQASVTFAIARHAAVDLCQVLSAEPDWAADRLPGGDLDALRAQLEAASLHPNRSADATRRLAELRALYEPFVSGLSRKLMMPLSPWWRATPPKDNWQSSPRRGHL
jgi:Ion channel